MTAASLPSAQRGIAFILVLWVIAMVAVLLGSFSMIARTENLQSRHLFETTQARYAAEAGLNLAVYELRMHDPMQRWQADGRSYRFAFGDAEIDVQITDDAGKIDINTADIMVVTNLLTSAGVEFEKAQELADAIEDWRDPDDLARPLGAEAKDYKDVGLSYGPRNGPFETVSELQQVLGMSYEIFTAIEPAITIYSGRNTPSAAYAPIEALRALPGMTNDYAQQLIQQRQTLQPGSPELQSLTLPDGTPLMADGGGLTYSVRCRATLPNGASAELDATVRMGGAGAAGRPYAILRWRDGGKFLNVLIETLDRQLARLRTRLAKTPLPAFFAWWGESLLACLPQRWRDLIADRNETLLIEQRGDEVLVLRERGRAAPSELGRIARNLSAEAQVAEYRRLRERIEDPSVQTIYCIDAGRVLRRTITLPAAAEENLRQVLSFEMDRQTPFKADQVYFDSRIVGRDPAGRNLQVELVLLPKPQLDAELSGLAGGALAIDGVDIWRAGQAGQRSQVNLLPPERRARRRDLRLPLNLGLIVLAFVLLILAMSKWLDNRAAAVESMREKVSQSDTQARQVSDLKRNLVDSIAGANFLSDKKRNEPLMVAILDDLTQRIPDDTFLERMNIENGQVQLQGQSREAAKLIGLLAESPYLSNPTFQGAIQPDARTSKERFQITGGLKRAATAAGEEGGKEPAMALEIKAPKDGRLLAVILLTIVLLLVYLLGFHWWFVAPHFQYTEQMADLREQQLRFARTIAEQPQIDLKMGEIRAYEQENQAFMPDADVNAASASLIQRLKQVVGEHAPDSNRCQVVSSQSYTSTEEELYRRVTISVRMRCDLEQLSAVLYDLENGKPYLFADQLMIYKQQNYVPPGGRAAVQPLDVRFNLSGYIRQSGRAPK